MDKKVFYLAATIGGGVGGYIPSLLDHQGGLSMWSIVGSFVGGLLGIYIVYKAGR